MLDALITLVLAFGAWRGFVRGALSVMVALFGWIVALVAGARLAEAFAPYMVFLQSENVRLSAGFLVSAGLILIFVHVLLYVYKSALMVLGLSLIDKLVGAFLGFMLGACKVCLVLGVLAPALVFLPAWQDATLGNALLELSPVAKLYMQHLASAVIA